MNLQILINHYKESEPIIHNFLQSLKKQTYKDYEIIIASDGADRISEDLLNQYSFKYQYLYLSHHGVCHTRNVLLEQSSADYVMFCDIDDEFSQDNGLELLMQVAEKTNADVIGSNYIGFTADKQPYIYEKDVIRVHGKIFKRQYLIDNNITFPDKMEINGDMKFLWLAYKLTNNIVWLDDNFYTWNWNEKSVTRANPYHKYSIYDRTLECYNYLIQDLIKRNRIDLYQQVLVSIFSMMYLDDIGSPWNTVPEEYKNKAKSVIKNFVTKYFKDYIKITQDLRYKGFVIMMKYYNLPIKDNKIFNHMMTWIQETVYSTNVQQLYGTLVSILTNSCPTNTEQQLALLRLQESYILLQEAMKK